LTSPEDRRKDLEMLAAGMAAGARAGKLAELLGVGLTTLQRWRRQFAGDEDGLDRRKGSPRLVFHRLTQEERQRILLTCNQPEFTALPGVNYLGGSRQLRRRVPPLSPPAMAGGGDTEN
jgi:transposase